LIDSERNEVKHSGKKALWEKREANERGNAEKYIRKIFVICALQPALLKRLIQESW